MKNYNIKLKEMKMKGQLKILMKWWKILIW
jgi:hypothetical protein